MNFHLVKNHKCDFLSKNNLHYQDEKAGFEYFLAYWMSLNSEMQKKMGLKTVAGKSTKISTQLLKCI
ncbi:MAG: hypothetical protein EAZ77_18325 [Nostocales cyanobacterium]|nr:MAG: hypothetical protein EAZ77_18325 [Nostocales cyanobacterium]